VLRNVVRDHKDWEEWEDVSYYRRCGKTIDRQSNKQTTDGARIQLAAGWVFALIMLEQLRRCSGAASHNQHFIVVRGDVGLSRVVVMGVHATWQQPSSRGCASRVNDDQMRAWLVNRTLDAVDAARGSELAASLQHRVDDCLRRRWPARACWRL